MFLSCRQCVSAALLLFAQFLCADDWNMGNGFRSRALEVPREGKAYLQRMDPQATGLDFVTFISEEKGLENSLRTDGAGMAAGDVDGDGLCDLFFCGMENSPALFRNLGNWKFTNVTASAGLPATHKYATAAAFADVDGDGDLDLLLNSLGGGTQLFLNDGKGHFKESVNCGLVRKFGATSMALADVDGNGTLDLYVANYATTKIEDRPTARFGTTNINGKITITSIDGVPMTSPELTNRYFVDPQKVVREWGEADIFYLNDGHGQFKAMSWLDGTFMDEAGQPLKLPELGFGLSVMFHDMNGDLAPDLYICNDLFPADGIWLNDGHGHFRAMSNLAVRKTCRFSMGLDFADINRDGLEDFMVVDMLSRDHGFRKLQTVGVNPIFLPVGQIDNRPQYKHNTLFLNRGDGTFAEIAQLAGLEATEWSWMPVFLDVDMDGFEDVLVTTGHHRDSLNSDAHGQILRSRRPGMSLAEHNAIKKKFYPILRTPVQAFRNRGDLSFEDKAKSWGVDYVGITHAMCLADLDNDGDQDVVITALNDKVLVYRNENAAPRVAVRLRGKAPNTFGVGAKIRLFGGAVPEQVQEMICGGRYLSGDDPLRVFAAGKATNGMRIEVTWRGGLVSVVDDVRPNRLYEIDESAAQQRNSAPTKSPEPLFTDASELINHSHIDDGFNDFERQPLLPRKFSQLGPGVTWYDFDRDGWEDLAIGTGVGGPIALFRNNGKGGFERWAKTPLEQPSGRDTTTLLGWPKASGDALLIGSSNYEDGAPSGSCALELDFARQGLAGNLPPWECSTGPLAMADWNGDGILDLFVGGRLIAGKYPDEPFSLLFRGTRDKFELDHASTKQIAHAGLVSGAVFSDLDGDGRPELVLACDWGPVRVYQFAAGAWQDRTSAFGLAQYSGWWNGVTTGDFDGDGRLDIVASNWGRNTKYQSFRTQPIRLYYGDWQGGRVDMVESYYDGPTKKVVPWCSYAVAKSLPWVVEQFRTAEAFGKASVADMLGERAKSARVLEVNCLETTVFLNRGNRFEPVPLPIQAQFAPAFGISVADFNGDGTEDIFLAQNCFSVDGDTSRYDAGRGLLLAGDGTGKFRAVSGLESGIKVYGEQRGCAVSDFDADGRVDLIVSQNGAQTKLYRNTQAKPALRVRLAGPPENPHGIGAVLRIGPSEKLGPAREIHSGAGYWSQDGAVQLLASAQTPTDIAIRWPGGKTLTAKIPQGAREISIDPAGQLKVLRR
jgi:hypothetical protein